jgi:hypothetical protein
MKTKAAFTSSLLGLESTKSKRLLLVKATLIAMAGAAILVMLTQGGIARTNWTGVVAKSAFPTPTPHRPAPGSGRYLVSPSNQQTVRQIALSVPPVQ